MHSSVSCSDSREIRLALIVPVDAMVADGCAVLFAIKQGYRFAPMAWDLISNL